MLHLVRVIEAKLWRGDEVVWETSNKLNTLHSLGQKFVLQAIFNTLEAGVPPFFYAGLDNRVEPAESDILSEINTEPAIFGYQRVAVSSSNGFQVSVVDDVYQATTGVLTFNGTGGTWGPVQNVFLATTNDNSGTLISTIALDGPHFVNDGERLTMRFGIALKDCPE